jgi:hypothetical protein
MNKRLFLALSLSLLTGCAELRPYDNAQNGNERKVAATAGVHGDHDALAQYFENVAREMQAKAEEQRKLLQHYEEKSYLYGRTAQDLKSHTTALLRKYNNTAEENRKEAAIHRQMALEEAQRSIAAKSK